MWSYEEIDKGFQLIWDIEEATNETIHVLSGIKIFFPYEEVTSNMIIKWDESEINKLVKGLNDGSIPFQFNGVDMLISLIDKGKIKRIE